MIESGPGMYVLTAAQSFHEAKADQAVFVYYLPGQKAWKGVAAAGFPDADLRSEGTSWAILN